MTKQFVVKFLIELVKLFEEQIGFCVTISGIIVDGGRSLAIIKVIWIWTEFKHIFVEQIWKHHGEIGKNLSFS